MQALFNDPKLYRDGITDGEAVKELETITNIHSEVPEDALAAANATTRAQTPILKVGFPETNIHFQIVVSLCFEKC